MKKKIIVLILGLIAGMAIVGCEKSEMSAADSSVQSEPTETAVNEIPKHIGSMDTATVMSDIKRAQEILKEDAGKLWGQELDSKIIVFDYDTREFIASENDAEGSFQPLGDMYTGTFPEDVAVANSTISYGGKSWATVCYSEEWDDTSKLGVYVHEMFHNNQPKLGMTFDWEELQEDASNENGMMDNRHMDTMDARILLKLEWEALYKALTSEGEEKAKAVEAAYAFRKARQDKYDAALAETTFEINEGMADYTMYKLVYEPNESVADIVKDSWKIQLDENKTPSLVRSFGYHSGALYGFLLDEAKPEWKKNISMDTDLGKMLKEAYNVDESEVNIDEIKDDYNYEEIYAYESKREEQRQQELETLMEQYVNGKVLSMPLKTWNMTMNPNKIRSLDGYGILYYEAEFYEDWGILTCNETAGMVMDTDECIVVPATGMQTDGNTIQGDGWSLILNEGYHIEEQENGNYTVVKSFD